MITDVVQDYLKTIYKTQVENHQVTTSSIAKYLEVSAGTATTMIKKLADMKLVVHEPYRGVRLTEAGQKTALEIIRHHRLVETCLAQVLGLAWDEVHDEAEKWEHALSEHLEDHIDEYLGHPDHDPHGAPIPSAGGELPALPRKSLLNLAPGAATEVVEVSDHDSELLRYYSSLGIKLKARVLLLKIEPFDGPLTIQIDNDAEKVISRTAAEHVFVR